LCRTHFVTAYKNKRHKITHEQIVIALSSTITIIDEYIGGDGLNVNFSIYEGELKGCNGNGGEKEGG
tara:strand:- start:547 stop:747 length:201 start_codon:yes stop_codon:yes gene_type:complete